MSGAASSAADNFCDVLVVGGALSGAATALLLKRRDPSLNIQLVEKNTHFKRRVGETTVEVSGYFCAAFGVSRIYSPKHS